MQSSGEKWLMWTDQRGIMIFTVVQKNILLFVQDKPKGTKGYSAFEYS